MKTQLLVASAALLAPTLLAPQPAGERIRFAPSEGASLTKTFETQAQFSLDSMSMKMNGQDMPAAPEMEMEMSMTQRVVVVDDYVAMGEGRPKKLRRRFDEMHNGGTVSMQVEAMGQSQNHDQSMTGKSELDGKTVVFTWNPDEERYDRVFDPESDERELLDGLEEDMDLRALLPKSEVAEGESWEIDVKKLTGLLAPGGNMAFIPEEGADDAMGGMGTDMGNMSDWISDLLEGEAKATLSAFRDSDGKRLAVIEIEFDINSTADLTERVSESLADRELPNGAEMDIDHIDIEFSMQGKGQLLWNMTANRLHAFEISGPVDMTTDMGMSMSFQGQDMDLEQSMQMSGTVTLTASVE